MPCTPKKTVRLIVKQGQHYFIALKSNQPTLYRTLEQLHQTAPCLSETQTTDTSHKRQVHRRAWVLITKTRKNMKNRLLKPIDKILLRKRALIESVNDPLKNLYQIEHFRHRSVWNFCVNLLAGLIPYTCQEKNQD